MDEKQIIANYETLKARLHELQANGFSIQRVAYDLQCRVEQIPTGNQMPDLDLIDICEQANERIAAIIFALGKVL